MLKISIVINLFKDIIVIKLFKKYYSNKTI